KGDDKREALLWEAIEVFAQRGLSAPTAAVSKAAGVAEGTLFTYFPTKDDLTNALYREIKLELAGILMSDFAKKKDVRSKLQHIWESYVNWGSAQSAKRIVLAQLQLSDRLTEETKPIGSAPFSGIQVMAREAIAEGTLRGLPVEFVTATLEALAQSTMYLMAAHPSKARAYRAAGFEVLWNGLSKKAES